MSQLSLYYDLLSQPSRALVMFVRAAKIPCQEHPISLRNREHRKEEYSKINKFNKVPAILHGDFQLSESVAILRYLCANFPVDDHWYPKDSKKMARVDEYLEWQHLNTRASCSLYILEKFVKPMTSGKRALPDKIQKLSKNLNGTLDIIENIWLKENNYIAGQDVSIADLLAVCELQMPKLAGFDILEGRPKLAVYMDRTRERLLPYYDDVHQGLYLMGLFGRALIKLRFLGRSA